MNPVEDENDWSLMLCCPDEPLVGFPLRGTQLVVQSLCDLGLVGRGPL